MSHTSTTEQRNRASVRPGSESPVACWWSYAQPYV